MDKKIIDQIKQEILCTEFLTKSKKGGKDKFNCPFCESGTGKNKTGALHFYKETNTFNCFSCGESGDVISLYEKINNLDFVAATKELASKIGIDTENTTPYCFQPEVGNVPPAPVAVNRPPKLPDADNVSPAPDVVNGLPLLPVQGNDAPLLMNQTEEETPPLDFTEYYQECRARLLSDEGNAAQEYLISRGLSLEAVTPFWVGFDPNSDPAYNPEKGVHHYCPRLIIPISKDFYLARRIDSGKEFKALYPRNGKAAIFNSKAFANQDSSNVIFVTEAAIDALSVISAGHQSIATNSVANVPNLVERLKFSPPINKVFVLAFDHDNAGNLAAEQMSRGLASLGITYILAPNEMYNGCKDMNESLCKDRDSFITACNTAEAMAIKMKEQSDALKTDPYNSYYRQEEFWKSLQNFRQSQTPTGIIPFDDALGGGFFEGLYLLAGVPSAGKTALALQISDYIAGSGRKVLFYELEMRYRNLKARLMSLHRNAQPAVNGEYVKSSIQILKTITMEEIRQFDEENKELLKNLSLIDSLELKDIDALKENIEAYINTHPDEKKPFIVIDYLQLLKAKSQGGARFGELSYILDVLMTLRNKYNLTILLLSAMSRENYNLPAGVAAAKETGDAEYAVEGIFVLSLRASNMGEFGGDKTKDKIESRKKFKEYCAMNPREVQLSCTKHRNGKAFFDIDFKYFTNADYFHNDGVKFESQTKKDQDDLFSMSLFATKVKNNVKPTDIPY